jgi:hypothetical protein
VSACGAAVGAGGVLVTGVGICVAFDVSRAWGIAMMGVGFVLAFVAVFAMPPKE